jgi:hypothetical protein
VIRALGWIVLLGALALGSLTRPTAEERATPLVGIRVDAAAVTGQVRPIWDEVNLWKLYAMFGVQHAEDRPRGWLREALPWVRYGRVVAALGGNYASAIAPWCDAGVAAPAHPHVDAHDCGHDGVPGTAARNELVREVEGRVTVDYAPFRLAVRRLAASGVTPHLNLSAAPAPFTAPVTDFTHYHWNAAPIHDFDGWRRFVAGAFGAVADLDPTGWRVSIVNEANCLTLIGWEQQVHHVGYAGAPAEYARAFVETARVVHTVAPGARLVAGNYVASDTFPGEDNLAEYLGALRAALAAQDELRWEDLSAISFSLYETPDTTVYEFVPVRMARAASALHTAGLPARPFKIDELEVHPDLGADFETRYGTALDPTLWAASWHAEALHTLLEAGTVVSVAPWLGRLIGPAADGTWKPYPKAHAYALYGLLVGQLRADEDADGTLAVVDAGNDAGVPRLATSGSIPCPPDAPRLHPERAASISAVATRTDDGVRTLITYHRNRPVPDDHGSRHRDARALRLTAAGMPPGAYEIRRLAIGGPDGAAWHAGTPRPLRWQRLGCRTAGTTTLTLIAREWIEANTVWLVDARRVDACRDA